MMFCTPLMAAEKKVEFTGLTLPFGTANYTMWTAFEQTFKAADSWIDFRVKETPGAIYIMKYLLGNGGKMAAGDMPYGMINSESGLVRWVTEGWAPFTKLKLEDVRAIFSLPAVISLVVTFDQDINSLSDLANKKVGVAGKARIFQTDFANKPYFDKGLGIWDEIDWQYLGAMNSKDAMLNGKIDAKLSYFYGNLEIAADGTYVCTELIPEPPTLELLNSGRKLNLMTWDPEVIKKSYDPTKDMAMLPILIKKGAAKGIDKDIWGRFSLGQAQGLSTMSDEMVEELIRVRHDYRKELEKYHAMMKLLPENPYPIGTPKHLVHPGVFKALKKMGIPIPE
jgi:TRAP-type uncharacterized transport system substrate-binding protein